MLTVDERLQILLHVKFTAKEFDCNLTREIVDLIDREGDLISRGRSEKSLEGWLLFNRKSRDDHLTLQPFCIMPLGLRKRISGLFLQFIQTPEFNPEMASHIKVLNRRFMYDTNDKYFSFSYLKLIINHGRRLLFTIAEAVQSTSRPLNSTYPPHSSTLASARIAP